MHGVCLKPELFQHQFARLIRGASPSSESPVIKPAGRLRTETAWEVYRRGYPARLTSALGETYETVWALLGDAEFFRLCAVFIDSQTSRSHNLGDYGEHFVSFLQNHVPQERAELLVELAHFEWLFRECFHEATPVETPPVDWPSLTAASDLKVLLRAHAKFCSSHYRVDDIHRNRLTGLSAEDLARAETRIGFLLYRSDDQVYVSELDPSVYALGAALAEGFTLNQAVERAHIEDAAVIQSLFAILIETRALAEISPL